MTYKTYNEQILEHLAHLQSNGLDVTELVVDSGSWIRCHEIGQTKGRGELAYITNTERLANGLLGIRTSFRGLKGIGSFQTYGHGLDSSDVAIHLPVTLNENRETGASDLHEQSARKAYGFWKHSNQSGSSDYLDRKSVGSYGIRFRSSEEYGNVAVVPMFDRNGRLWNSSF